MNIHCNNATLQHVKGALQKEKTRVRPGHINTDSNWTYPLA